MTEFRNFRQGLSACLCLAASAIAPAATFELPAEGSLVGAVEEVRALAEDTLLDIARRHNLGYEEIKLANPRVDPWLPGAGTRVTLPTRFILPRAPRRGLILNLAEMRLYYYPPKRKGKARTVITHPVSIGRYDWETPLGLTRIVSKVRDPAWYPPRSVRAEHAAAGSPLPGVVPAGPDNPLGKHALKLGRRGYLIHGTNKPFGIGMRVSHGCVRMYPEDIASLFDRVPVGTQVRIVNQPVKVGWDAQARLYVEAHPRAGELELQKELGERPDHVKPVVAATSKEQSRRIDWSAVKLVVETMTGMPVSVFNAAMDSADYNYSLRLARQLASRIGPDGRPIGTAGVGGTGADRRSGLELRLSY